MEGLNKDQYLAQMADASIGDADKKKLKVSNGFCLGTTPEEEDRT